MERGQTVIAEGMHLEPSIIRRLMETYGNQCLCFFIRQQQFDNGEIADLNDQILNEYDFMDYYDYMEIYNYLLDDINKQND